MLGKGVSFDDYLAGSINRTVMRISNVRSKSEICGSGGDENRFFCIFRVMFFDFFQGFDEAMTIFPLLFVAELYSHLIYYLNVPA